MYHLIYICSIVHSLFVFSADCYVHRSSFIVYRSSFIVQCQLIVVFNLLRQFRPSWNSRNYSSPRWISTKPSASYITNGV
jgi:hypothetical protein